MYLKHKLIIQCESSIIMLMLSFNLYNAVVFVPVHIDITRVFNNALLQQTQQVDTHGEKTVAALYTQW
jgi:hypothetical protein